MDFSRIENVIDIPRMQAAEIGVIGVGGAMELLCNLVRSGARRLHLFDPDYVSRSNIARQAHDSDVIGTAKVIAAAAKLERINPDIVVRTHVRDVTTMDDAELAATFRGMDLLINATDRFAVHAFGNKIALTYGIDAVWVGLYPRGQAGEAIWWTPEIDACYRCLCAKRYALHDRANAEGRSLDPSSDGCTIFDISLLDAITGCLSVGLLTRGANNRFGRLIPQLRDRNFIQTQLDPLWMLNGRNPVRDVLGVAADNPAFFAWNAVARSDPDRGLRPCPDCAQYRGHVFTEKDGRPVRVRPDGR